MLDATADLLSDSKLVKLFIVSMTKTSTVRELIQAILAGLTCAGARTAAAAASAAGQLDSCCGVRSLVESGSSEAACFFTLTAYYNLVSLSTPPDEAGDAARAVSSLRARIIECEESLEALTQLHAARHSARVRCSAVATLLRLYMAFPGQLEAHRASFLPRLLLGVVRLAESLTRAPLGLGELGRVLFRDLALCLHAAPPGIVLLASHCAHLLQLVDRVEAGDAEWRLLLAGVLTAFALRVESARVTVAGLSTPQRLLRDLSSDSAAPRLRTDLLLLLALSRSVEVLRSLLVDQPGLVDVVLASVLRARAAKDVDSLSLGLKLPVAGAVHARLVERQVGRQLAEVARARRELPLQPRLLAIAALTNLALQPDATDVAAAREAVLGGGAVSLRSPLGVGALVELLDEAKELAGSADRQQLAACVAQLTRNLARNAAQHDDDDDDEEEEREDGPEALHRLTEALLALVNAPSNVFGVRAKEAALMAVASLAASRRIALQPLTGEWAAHLMGACVREPPSNNCQTAALVAIQHLDALELPWRRRLRQELEASELEAGMRTEGAVFLRKKLIHAFREAELANMSGSESS